MLLTIFRCSSWCSKLNSNDIILLKGLFENNLFHDQSIYSIVIFLTILITFSFYDVVMMLGENRCWSLKVEAGMAL